jgi:hypothetical protein
VAAQSLAAWITANITTLALLKASGTAEVELDPRSSDFGKARIGNTRFDLHAGYQPIVRYIAQFATGEMKDTETKEIRKTRGRISTAERFLRSKLAPGPGLAWDWAEGRDFVGNKLDEQTIQALLYSRLTPLAIQDTIDAVQQQGGPLAAIVMGAAVLGVGVQTYEPQTPKPGRP